MSADLIQGKKGSGKSKLAVMWMRDHLMAGRLVATNLDLYMDKLMPPMSKAVAIRVPDKPTASDLVALGPGNNGDRYNEEEDGLLVLDELATWLNARTFQDKDRGPVMHWLVHSRKYSWGTALICQDMVQIDKQVRESQIEYVTRCVRMDKMRIPFVGGALASLLGEKYATLPKAHIATRRLGCDPKGLKARSWWYRDGGVQTGYDTLQVFSTTYPHGTHSLLSAWHLVGRHMAAPVPWWRRLFSMAGTAAKRPPPTSKKPLVAALQRCLAPDERLRHWKRLARLGHV